MGGDLGARIRHVTAVLGPTNTGKTHLAIERMLGHESGMIGLPLRLLAREVYDKIGQRIGFDKVALVTGEEKIKPQNATYWVSTVEAMPRDVDVSFLAIDEVQLAADPERGHVFTDRLLNARGTSETLLLGAQTMRDVIQDLIPGANFISRPRLSKLTYAGPKKITRLPKRTAIVAFSANEVYSLAELIRRQSGGAAVVLGALSPRTRNAQVGLYQSGEVDYLVATDAIGMGLNLDLDHVAFAATRKFDGHTHRDLNPSELAQIAGRAGRHMNDGTFGVTGAVEPLGSELIEKLESHTFDPVRVLQWRSSELEFSSVERLKESLRDVPTMQRLVRARTAEDVEVLEIISREEDIAKLANVPANVAKLWDACQVPDYRKISIQAHAELVSTIFKFVMGPSGRIDEDWFEKQVAFSDKTDGDIDTLSNRIAHIRTWTFVSNRADWLRDPEHWQGRTREIEEKLSDALHEQLTQRFVDRRTSALMKGMRDKDELSAEIAEDGQVQVEGHFVGKLSGFRFEPDANAEGVHGKATRSAAAQALSGEVEMRIRRVCSAKGDAFRLATNGEILWRDMVIARIETSDDPLKPIVTVIADEDYVAAADREKIRERLAAWLKDLIGERLKPLVELSKSDEISGLARGIAFRLVENFGVLKREDVANEVKSLDQTSRAQLRKYGVRFGAFNIFIPVLLKPASAELGATLWASKYGGEHGLQLDKLPAAPRAGLTSLKGDIETPEAFYRVYGYHQCGPRLVRLDILERVADLIRPLLSWRKKECAGETPPAGSTGDGGFKATPEMMSVLGCSPDELSHVLNALGFVAERRPIASTVDGPSGDIIDANSEAEPVANSVTANGSATLEVGSPSATVDVGQDVEVQSVDASDVPSEKKVAAVDVGDAVSAEAADDGGEKKVETVKADEAAFEELWRPRRKRGRGDRKRHARGREQGRGADQNDATGSRIVNEHGAVQEPSPGTSNRGDSRHGGPDRKRNEAAKGRGFDQNKRRHRDGKAVHSDKRSKSFQSAPPRAAGGRKGRAIDPDSPFAALAGLRDDLSKSTPKSGGPKDKGQ